MVSGRGKERDTLGLGMAVFMMKLLYDDDVRQEGR